MRHRSVTGFTAALVCAAALLFAGLTPLRAQESPPSTQPAPQTRPARTPGAATVPSFRTLSPLAPPFTGTTRPTAEVAETVPAPASLDELRSLERQVEEMTKKVIPATVGLQIGGSSGSGVIVSPDGWILTAGHVSGAAEQPVTIILHDGRRLKGVTLGANNDVDSGLIRIIDPGPFPYAEVGDSNALKLGQWLVSIGHPGGYRVGRSPVVRLGRLLETARDNNDARAMNTLTTDNTLVGGDSGGPLYDLQGRVVGIHSRINPAAVTTNMHVPVDTFVRDWARLTSGDVYGSRISGNPWRNNPRVPHVGIDPENVPGPGAGGGVRVRAVTTDSPADKAGLRVGDVIYRVDGRQVRNLGELTQALAGKRGGEISAFDIKRDGAEDQLVRVRLGEPRASTQPNQNRNRRNRGR